MALAQSTEPGANLPPSLFVPERELALRLVEEGGLEELFDTIVEEGRFEGFYERVLAHQVRITPGLSPRLSALASEVRAALRFDGDLELFVTRMETPHPGTTPSLEPGVPHAVSLPAWVVERFDDDELRFILGHEIGHVAQGHGRLMALLFLLTQRKGEGDTKSSIAGAISAIPGPRTMAAGPDPE